MSKKVKYDIRWLAGLLEGEGTFCWAKHESYRNKINTKGRYANLQIVSTDKDVIAQVCKMFGNTLLGPYQPSYSRKCKKIWVSSLRGKRAIIWSKKLYPYMFSRRKAQINKITEEVK